MRQLARSTGSVPGGRTIGLPRARSGPAARAAGRKTLVVSLLGMGFVGVLMLHLMAELAGRLDPADPAGLPAVLGGMAAVQVLLLPFVIGFARSAFTVWQRDGGGR